MQITRDELELLPPERDDPEELDLDELDDPEKRLLMAPPMELNTLLTAAPKLLLELPPELPLRLP